MPNIAYFCAMVLRTHCTGHCSGLYGKYGIPVRGGGGLGFCITQGQGLRITQSCSSVMRRVPSHEQTGNRFEHCNDRWTKGIAADTTPAQAPPPVAHFVRLRSPWSYCRLTVRIGGWRYKPIFPDPEMGQLAWCVTHIQMVSLLQSLLWYHMRARTCQNGGLGGFLVRWGALAKELAQKCSLAGEN